MTRPTVQVPFLGDGAFQEDGATTDTILDVAYIAEYPRGADGLCAYCKGDPCAETSPPDSLIARFFARFEWAATCPCCDGRPS